MQRDLTYVGIDVAKEMLDVALRPAGERWRVAHDAAGLEQLVARLPSLRCARGSRPTSRGWSKSAANWRTSSARRCSRVPSGVSVISCCAACRAWASSSH